jgi:hypothetical protein
MFKIAAHRAEPAVCHHLQRVGFERRELLRRSLKSSVAMNAGRWSPPIPVRRFRFLVSTE